MKKLALLLLAAACLPLGAAGQTKGQKKKAEAQTEAWRYEIESVSVGQPGSVVIKVWSFSKKPAVAQEQSKKNAVHGVIYKGVPAKDRVPAKRALITDAVTQREANWLNMFFDDGGEYMRYVALTNSGAAEVMKTDKKEYKVGVTVTVHYNDLRRALEEAEIIKKLGSGF